MSRPFLGIDISKEHVDVALYINDQYRPARFANDKDGFRRLSKWLKKHKAQGCSACMEATGRYGELLAEHLFERSHPVSVVNPAIIKRYAQSRMRRNKTDAEDAKVIAHYCATQAPDLWQPPEPHIRELQEMTRRLQALKENRVRERNRLQSGLRSEIVITDVEANIAFLNQQIVALEKAIDQHIDQFPDLKQKVALLCSIPSIGSTTASAFIAEVPDISRFRNAPQLAAYAGLSPSHNHSGKAVHSRGYLAKVGSRRLRTLFFMPQMSARRCNPTISALVARLKAVSKQPRTIRGAIMRKLLHLAYGVLKSGKPFDPLYSTNLQVAA